MFLKVYKFKILMALLVVPFLAFAQPPGWELPDPLSPVTHVIVVPDGISLDVGGVPVEADDWIGVFYADGGDLKCGGSAQIGADVNDNIIAYGSLVPTYEGFALGEAFVWKFYDVSESMEYATQAEYVEGPQAGFFGDGPTTLSAFTQVFEIAASADPSLLEMAGNVDLEGINLDPAYNVVSWEWTDGMGGSWTGQTQTVFVDQTTTFTVEATTDMSETATATVTVTLSQVFAGDDAEVCSDPGTYVLADAIVTDNFLSFSWSTSGDGAFDDPGAINPTYTAGVQDIADGMVVLTLTAIGPNGPVSDQVELTYAEPATVDIIPDDIYLCADATSILEVADFINQVEIMGNYANLQWSAINGAGDFSDDNDPEPTYFPSPLDLAQFDNDGQPTVLQINVSSEDPCELIDDVDQVNLRYVRAPQVVEAGPAVEYCIDPVLQAHNFADAVVVFGANPFVPEAVNTIEWTTDGDGTFDDASLVNPTYFFTADELAGTTTINFTLTAETEQACGPVISETSISLQAPPDAYAGPDAVICEDGVFEFTESYANNYSLIQWSGINGTGDFSDENIEQPTYTPSFQDILQGCVTLQIEASAIDPCVGGASDQMELCFQLNPVVVAGDDATICANESYEFNPTVENTNGTYLWEVLPIGDIAEGQLLDADQLNATYVAANPEDTYKTLYFQLTAGPIDPCTVAASDVMELYIECAPDVYAGEDFTVCETENPELVGTAECVSETMWATTGDGYFCCPDDLVTTYYPGPNDKEGCVTLVLVGYPQAPCSLYELDKVVVCFDPAPMVDAGPDKTVCQGESIMIEGSSEDVCGIQWFVYNGNGTFDDETINTPTYTPNGQDLIAGTVQLIITGAPCGTCTEPAMDTMNLTIQPLPVVEIEEEETTICEDQMLSTCDLDITVENEISVEWTTAGDGGFADPAMICTDYTPGAGDIANGLTVLTLTAAPTDPCLTSASDEVILNIQLLPTVDILPSDTTICETDVFDFTDLVVASNYDAIQWTNLNGSGDIDTETELEPIYYPGFVELEQGFVELSINVSPIGPCIGGGATDFITIYFQEEVNIEIGQSMEICEDATFTPEPYTIENNCGVLWQTAGDGTFDDPTLEYPVYTPGDLDIANEGVVLSLTGEGCSTCDDLTVEVFLLIQPNPTADAGADGVVCEYLCAPPWTNGIYEDLMGAVTNASSFMWTTSGDGMFVPGADVLDPDYVLGDGDIANGSVELCLIAEPIDPCLLPAEDCITLTVQPFPVADAGPDQEICEGEDVQLDGETEFASGVFWDFALYGEGDGFWSNQIIEDPVYTPGPEDIERGYVELIMVAFPISPCTYPDADNMTVTIIQQPEPNAGMDSTICAGETLQLDGTCEDCTGGVLWTTAGDGFFDPSDDILNPQYVPGPDDIAAGSVELCLTGIDGTACQADYTDCLMLTILPPPLVNAGPDGTVCEDGTFCLDGATESNTSSVMWSTSGDGSFDDPMALNACYTPGMMDIENEMVTLTLTGNPLDPCTATVSDDMMLDIQILPTVFFEPNEGEVCEYDTYQLMPVIETDYAYTVSWTHDGNGSLDDPTADNPVYTPSLDDELVTFTITVTPGEFCSAEVMAEFFLTVNDEPAVGFCFNDVLAGTGDTFTYCFDEEAVITLCEVWSGTGPFDIEYSLNGEPAVLIEDVMMGDILFEGLLPVGNHVVDIVSITDANGCSAQDVTPYTANIVVNPEPDAHFCVNGDVSGYGDVFEFCYDQEVTVDMCEILSGTGPFEVCWTLNNGPVECLTVDEGGVLFQGLLPVGEHLIQLVSVTDANGCVLADPSLYNMTIIINEEPDVDFCVNGDPVGYGDTFEFCWTDMIDVTICEVLSGEGPFEVCWTLNGGAVECATVDAGGSLFNSTLPLGEHVVELVSLTDANGCMLADPSNYVMNFNIIEPALGFCFNGDLAETGETYTLCYDETMTVTLCEVWEGTGPFDIEYSLNGEPAVLIEDVMLGDVLFEGLLPAGSHVVDIVSITDANGCAASDVTPYTANIVVNPEPDAHFCVNGDVSGYGDVFEFCYDQEVTVDMCEILSGTGPFEVCWTLNNGPVECLTVDEGGVLFQGLLPVGEHLIQLVSVTDANGCVLADPSLYNMTIIINEEPDVDFCVNGDPVGYGDVFTFCYDEVVDVTLCETLSGTGPFEVCYQLNAEPEVCVTVAEGESIFTGTLPAGNHTVQLTSLTDANGCVLADPSLYTMQFVINPEPDAHFCVNGEISGYGDTFNFCDGDNIVVDMCEILSGTGPFEICYTLDGGNVVCATVDEGGELFNGTLEPGTHEIVLVSMTDANGCVLADPSLYTMTIFVQDAPIVNAGMDLQTCEESPVAIIGTEEYTSSVAWSVDPVDAGTFDPVDDVSTVFTPAAGVTGVVDICLTGQPIGPCTVAAVDCIELTIIPAPAVDAGDDISVCDNVQSVPVSAVASNYSSLLWSNNGGDGFFVDETLPSTEYIPGIADILNGVELCVTVQPIDPPCTEAASDCLTVTFIPSPIVEVGDDATICEGDTEFPLEATVFNSSGLNWTSSGDGTFSDPTAEDPIYYPGADETGDIELCLEALPLAGCDTPVVVCLTLTIIPDPAIEPADPMNLDCDLFDFDLNAWMPIPLNPVVTGGETYQWSTDGDGNFADETALNTTYELGPAFDKWNGIVTLTLCVQGPGNCGVEVCQDFELYVPQQIIEIDSVPILDTAGVIIDYRWAPWRGISSYVEKSTTPVDELMDPVVMPGENGSLIIMIDKIGTSFWADPDPAINNLGNWDAIGYQAKFREYGCLPIYGDNPYDTTGRNFMIDGSFTYLPVLTNQEISIDNSDLFEGHDEDILLIYDWLEGGLWTPDTGIIKTLDTLKPGFAYLMVNKQGFTPYEITFPAIDLDGSVAADVGTGTLAKLHSDRSPWNDVINTSMPHFIVFSEESKGDIQSGDIIGAFNQYNECVGSAEFNNRAELFNLLAMGDDPVTEEIEGYESGESMNFKLYRPSTGETFDVSFTYDPEYPNYDNMFAVYGVSKVVDMTMSVTGIGNSLAENNINVFPNPATDVINIASDYSIKSVTLINYVGQVVYTNDVNGYDFQINVSSYVTGMYMLNIETTDGNIITKRIAVE